MIRIRTRAVVLAVLVALPLPALAQDSLADIKAELAQLSASMAQLKGELNRSQGAGTAAPVAGSALDRMNAMETELIQLTAKTEQLQLRINRVVEDGTNRIGDLEFRVTELEGGDVSKLGDTKPLGGPAPKGDAAAAAPLPAPTPGPAGGGAAGGATPDMAVNEQSDFDAAKKAFDAKDYRKAADLFADYSQTYPGGALKGDADFFRGEALMSLGETGNAARAWLASFSGDPDGEHAPDALLKLGLALNSLGQAQEACVTLGQVPARFPATDAASQADKARASMNCG